MKGVGAKDRSERLRLPGWSCVPRGSTEVYMRCGIQENLCRPALPPLPRLISPASLRIYIHLPAKGRTILAFHFPVQGFSLFADKCSPIHSDRCHIASLPLWYIASDPATCNKESAPGTALPGQHSDTGDYFKGASLSAPSAETLAGRHVHKHELQECGYQLVSGSGNDNAMTHSLLVSGHPDAAQYLRLGFMPLRAATAATLVPRSLLRCGFAGQSSRNNLCKGKGLMLLPPAEAHFTLALIIPG